MEIIVGKNVRNNEGQKVTVFCDVAQFRYVPRFRRNLHSSSGAAQTVGEVPYSGREEGKRKM